MRSIRQRGACPHTWHRVPWGMTLHRFAFVAATALVLAALPATAPAATPGTPAGAQLTISPTLIELRMRPGESARRELTVSASGSQGIQLTYEHADFGFDRETYAPTFIEDEAEQTTSFSTRGWFEVSHTRLALRAGASRKVTLTVNVPENATPGTHLGAAFFQTVAPKARPGATQVRTSIRTGPLVLIAVEGGTRPRPKLRRFDAPRLRPRGPVRPVRVTVDNEGTSYFRAQTTLTLDGPLLDEPVRSRSKPLVVIPDQPRDLVGGDASKAALGSRTSLPPGRYTLELRVRVEPGSTVLVKRRSIWIIPPWLWGLAAFGLAMLGAGAFLGFRHLRHRWAARHDALPVEDAAHEDLDGEAVDDDELDHHELDHDALDDLDLNDDDLNDDDLNDGEPEFAPPDEHDPGFDDDRGDEPRGT